MRILLFNGNFGIQFGGASGASCHLRAMARAFMALGHDVIGASIWPEKAPLDFPLLSCRPKNRFYPLRRWPELREIGHNRRFFRHLRSELAKNPPDLIYERHALFCDVGLRLEQAFGIPRVLEVNAPQVLERECHHGLSLPQRGLRWERHILAQSRRVVVVSEALKGHVQKYAHPEADIRVFDNGVDLNLFYPQRVETNLAQSLGLPERALKLAFMGSFKPWHRLDFLLALMEKTRGASIPIHLLCVGDGPLRAPFENRLKAGGLSHRVHFSGHMPQGDIPRHFALCDLALSLGGEDYFCPLKVNEYLACALPVLATDTPVHRRLLREGGGLLLPADPAAWREAMENLAVDRSQLKAMGAQGLLASQGRAWQAVAQGILNAFLIHP